MNPDWKARYETAVLAAGQAAQLALRYFDTGLPVEWKQDQSPVTKADREAEQLLRRTLLDRFPDDGFLGEESGNQPGGSGYRWIIDPIDGTRNFVRGIPVWATLVGLEYKGEQIAGVAVLPAMNQVYRALRGEGAYRGERCIHVSDVSDLRESMMFYSALSWFEKAGKAEVFVELSHHVQRQRGFGDFYGFMLVAQGSGEMMVEYGVHPWDIAALRPIVEEAGGRLTDWDGGLDLERADVLASNGKLHDTTLAILNHRAVGTDGTSAHRE